MPRPTTPRSIPAAYQQPPALRDGMERRLMAYVDPPESRDEAQARAVRTMVWGARTVDAHPTATNRGWSFRVMVR